MIISRVAHLRLLEAVLTTGERPVEINSMVAIVKAYLVGREVHSNVRDSFYALFK